MRSLLTTLFLIAALQGPATAKKPNIVFFLVDDLGYMDIGAYNPGTFYETPNVDQLAGTGVKFTNGYAANPVCSPTRFSIMTGKYPTRAAATNYFSGRRSGRYNPAPLHSDMPLEEVTLAEALKEAGYQTAFLGKWHLGPSAEFWPEKQGFDINVGGHNRGAPPGGYFSPYKNPRLEDGPKDQHLTARLADEAEKIMADFHAKGDPFLIYLSFYTVHTPLQAPGPLVAKYQKKAQKITGEEFGPEEQVWPGAKERRVRVLQKHPTYAAMVETMDTAVGRVLDQLDELGIADDTIVCFTSDNGGLSTSEGSPTSNLPLRGGKGWLYEGGIREPFIIRYPAAGKASVSGTPVISTDFYPTLLELAGLPARPGQHLDGVSLADEIRGGGASRGRGDLFWHYPHYSNQGGFPGGAIRSGPFKLVERFEDGRVHLYNLDDDPGEREDLAGEMPGRVGAMRPKLHAWYKEVGAKFLQAKGDSGEPWRP